MSGLMMALTLDQIFDLDTALAVRQPKTPGGGGGVSEAELATVMTGDDDVCTVCMEKFRSGVAGKKAPCGHTFHSNCIVKWLCLHNSCPLCRSPVTAVKFPL